MSELKNERACIRNGKKQTNKEMEELQNNTNLKINENRNHMETTAEKE